MPLLGGFEEQYSEYGPRSRREGAPAAPERRRQCYGLQVPNSPAHLSERRRSIRSLSCGWSSRGSRDRERDRYRVRECARIPRARGSMTAILGISAFYHDSAAALVRRRRDRRRGAGGALHPQEARPRLPGQRDRLLPARRRGSSRSSSTTSASTTSRCSSSSACSRPTWPSPRRASARSSRRCRCGCKQKLHLPREIRQGLGGALPQAGASSPSTTSRTRPARSSRRPSRRRPSSPSTAWASGPPPASATAAATGSSSDPRAALPALARACSTRPSPTSRGFKVNSGEYKLMGLAPYGEPSYADPILDKLLDLKEDGSFRHGHVVLQLLPGPDDDLAEVRRALRRPAAHAGVARSRSARWTWRPRSSR